MPEVARCRGCRAPIIWVRTASGSRMPLDAEPAKRVVILDQGGEAALTDREATRALDWGRAVAAVATTYTPHHATCPDAESFRREAG